MNRTLLLLTFLFITTLSYSQVEIHWLINKDKIIHCDIMQSGKFIHKKTDCVIDEGYSIEMRDGFVIEKVDDGKYYLKSKIVFENDCKYVLTVLESTIPGYEEYIGRKIYTEILETASSDNLIKLRSRIDEEWTTFVLEKIEN